MELLQSPPFRQQLDSFTYVSHQNLIFPFTFLGMLAGRVCNLTLFSLQVLRTGQIDLNQFGIDPSQCKQALFDDSSR